MASPGDITRIEGKSFGQRRPPLSVIIKGILEKYPDGQIFKEVIQNADDARATHVKFVLDRRDLLTLSQCLVDHTVRKELHRFQGPALLAYNNAVFSERDWEGIQNLQQSGKAKDPFKVGKFGIGFNSVYHITDLPVIISGEYCGYLDPQEQLWKGESGKIFKLAQLQMKPDILAPFVGMCGFEESLLEFSGQTIFRFPLRNAPSDLSEKCYSNLEHIQTLIAALQEEVKYLLLFLRSVQSITITERDYYQEKQLLSVNVSQWHSVERHIEQREFIDKVYSTFAGESPYSVSKVVSSAGSFDVVVSNETCESKHHWLVVHQVGSTDTHVREKAEKEHVLPWVGTAIEIQTSADGPARGGRLFCFLPMPCEATAPIPVHINGTFALSDSRRALKWPAAERKNDPQAEWNKLLVEHCLPSCYVKLILELIKLRVATPDEVYDAMPDADQVKHVKEWSGILAPFFQKLLQHPIVHSKVHGGRWIRADEAVFLPTNESIPTTVETVLLNSGVNVARVSDVVWNAFIYSRISIRIVTPKYFRQILKKKTPAYQSLKRSEKLDLLSYCLKDNDYGNLAGLELLPLINGSFIQFSADSYRYCYLCSTKFPKELLPDCSHRLVDPDDNDQLEAVAKHNCTQLRMLREASVANLLKQTMPPCGYSRNWLAMFWAWVRGYSLSLFENLPLVPVGENEVAKLTKSAGVVYFSGYCDINTDLTSALCKYQVKVTHVQTHSYLMHSQLHSYLHQYNGAGVLDAMNSIHGSNLGSVTPSIAEANALQTFLYSEYYSIRQKLPIFRQLSIFCTLQQSQHALCSLNAVARTSTIGEAIAEAETYGFKPEYLPPSPLVLSYAGNQRQLLESASVQFMNKVKFLYQIIFPRVKQQKYSEQVTENLMTEVLQDFHSLRYSYPREVATFVETLKSLPFLRNSLRQCKCPKEMFDPSDSDLCNLFAGEDVFPLAPYTTSRYLNALRSCGLRELKSVTSQELIDIVSSIKINFSVQPVSTTTTNYKRAKAVVKFLFDHPSWLQQQVKVARGLYRYTHTLQEALIRYAREYSWVPVCSVSPQSYPSCLQWKGATFNQHLASNGTTLVALYVDIDMSPLPLIMGSEAVFVEGCLPQEFAQSLYSCRSALAAAVIGHLRRVVQQKDSFDCDVLESIVKKMYSTLTQFNKSEIMSLSELGAWIWVGGSTFCSPHSVALKLNPRFRHNLEPFVYLLPNSLSQSKALFTQFGVEDVVSPQQIFSVLQKDLKVVPSLEAWSVVRAILNWAIEMSNEDESILQQYEILVPGESDSEYPQLESPEDLVYAGNNFLRTIAVTSGEDFQLVHSMITNDMAQSLGVTPLATYLDISEDIMADAGQHEPLVQRLKNILREYKDGLTIIKELLQNADDAGATELNILYDARNHSTSNLLFQDMNKAHGPALVVHNNVMFTDEDFTNITKLAGATKADKPLKIGKFGLGFCSVYHITDVPSFISRDYLYIFDPSLEHLGKAVKDRSQPGKRIKFTSHHLARSQQLSPYINLFGFHPSQQYSGTMFRFPFRQCSSEISSVLYNEHSVEELKEMIVQEGSKLLLFLRNIRRITFSTIRDREHAISNQLVVQREDVLIPTCDVFWENITIELSGSPTVTREKWLVSEHSQEIYCSSSQTTESSVAAVACQLNDKGTVCSDLSGEVFCFLPLSVSTGLPVHVSANFGVINNRRGIWTSDSSCIKGEKEVEWNLLLMKVTVSQAYVKLLRALKYLSNETEVQKYEFFSLWPLYSALKSKNPWEIMVSTVYRCLCSEKLFYSNSISKWLMLQDSQFLDLHLFSVNRETSLAHPQCIIKAVEYLKMPIVYLPAPYRALLQQANVKEINQDKFVGIFFAGIKNFETDIDVRNDVLFFMFKLYSHEIDECQVKESALKKTLKSTKCIPCTPNGQFLAQAKQLVYPSVELSTLFDSEDGKYPINKFCKDPAALRAMIDLGLITNTVPWSLLIDCASGIEELYKHEKARALRRIKQILDCIQQNMDSATSSYLQVVVPNEAKQLANVRFLPVMSKPKAYPIFWKGEGQKLLSGCELAYYREKTPHAFASRLNMPCLVGTQLAVISTLLPPNGCGWIQSNVQQVLGLHSRPKIEIVLSHFCCVVQTFCKSQKDLRSNRSWINNTCEAVYEFLEDSIKDAKQLSSTSFSSILSTTYSRAYGNAEADAEEPEPTNEEKLLSAYQDKPFIFTGHSFVVPSLVAQDWKVNGPYLYTRPESLAAKHYLTKALAVKSSFEIADLLAALEKMYEEHGSNILPDKCHSLVNEIIQCLNLKFASNKTQKEMIMNAFLPDESYRLYHVSKLSYNDAPWCRPETVCVLTHPLLVRETALAIGIKPIRNRFLERYVSSNQQFGLPFGQREKLTVRIKNILRDYPLDATFLKELIQNADDAKAKKMCVILDRRSHGTCQILSETWSELQGPALLVWNDAEFSECDLKGIQQLGLGSKRDDSESIGQFGIGFNVVYHITDCPSFITGERTLCILDPHCCYAPEATDNAPGRRFDNLNPVFWKNLSDLRGPYLRDRPPNLPSELQSGSLFRFPLRRSNSKLMHKSELVDDKTEPLNADLLYQKLHDWVPQVKDSLLFLNHLTQFQYFVISEDSSVVLHKHFEVFIEPSTRTSRNQFHQRAKEFPQTNHPEIIMYPLFVVSRTGQSETVEEWLVQQGVGDIKNPEQKWCFINQTIPKHGIAALISTTRHLKTPFRGKAFCFLPLPISTTNLPVHINGQFVLNSSRRSLWSSDSNDDKKSWNDNLIQAISSSYAKFLNAARKSFVTSHQQYSDLKKLESALNNYYLVFPYWNLPSNEEVRATSEIRVPKPSQHNPEKEWKVLAEGVFMKLLEDNAPILASLEQLKKVGESPTFIVKWSVLQDAKPFNQAHFIPEPCRGYLTSQSLKELLIKVGMTITCAPYHLKTHFGEKLCEATPSNVFNFYIKFYRQLVPSAPCHVSQTRFETADAFAKFTWYISTPDFVLAPHRYPQSPFGYPLLLTADEHLRVFDKSYKVLSSKYSDLFPRSSSEFLHYSILQICLPNDYYAQEESFDRILNILQCNVSPSLLYVNRVSNSGHTVIKMESLRRLWKCLCDDQVFNCHQEMVLKHLALLPTSDQQLFSTSAEFLPLVTPGEVILSDGNCVTFKLLECLGMPVLDKHFVIVPPVQSLSVHPYISALPSNTENELLEKVKDSIQQFCSEMTDHAQVLKSLYSFHLAGNKIYEKLLVPQSDIVTLFEYFSNIHFRKDAESVKYIKSLPLFKSISGKYTFLQDKDVYTWPVDCCVVAYSKWADHVFPQAQGRSIVFLEENGAWKTLNPDLSVLGGSHLDSMDVYRLFIFDAFGCFDAAERKEHLTFIRDYLFNEAKHQEDKSNMKAVLFMEKLRHLPCLIDSQTDQLRPISEFCHPFVSVFELFAEHFSFLSEDYTDHSWLKFFIELGLKTELTEKDFIKFCNVVADGNHKKLYKASNELLKYLFSKKAINWHKNASLLAQIGKIPFVKAEISPRLSWIKAPCSPVNSYLQLTTLQGAAVLSCARLVWTVMPVVNVPSVSALDLILAQEDCDAEEWNENLQKMLGMITDPNVEAVHRNIINISNTGLANFDLFTKYNPAYLHDSSKDDIVQVISDNLRFLGNHDSRVLTELQMVTCIPVDAEGGSTVNVKKPVLVNSLQVVHTVDEPEPCLQPYISTIPMTMSDLTPILADVGVTSSVQIKHLQYLLKVIHSEIGQNQLFTNHQLPVRTAVLMLLRICCLKQSEDTNQLSQLYLPSVDGTLMLSTKLVVMDTTRYKINDLDFSGTEYRIFFIPPDTRSADLRKLVLMERQMESDFVHLPKQVRPKGILLSSEERLVNDPISERIEQGTCLCEQILHMATLHTQIKIALPRLFLNDIAEIDQETCELFADNISELLETLQVIAIKDLKVNVYFTLTDPPHCLGTAKVPFLLSRQLNGSVILYVNGEETCDRLRFWNDLSLHICIHVAKTLGKKPTFFFKFCKHLGDSLKIKTIDDLQALSNLSFDALGDINPSTVKLVSPKLGHDIPEHLLSCLDHDINHIFRAQEWVGYEIDEDQFIYAIVLHRVNTEKDKEANNAQQMYYIQYSEDENGCKEVKALDLYKIVEGSKTPIVEELPVEEVHVRDDATDIPGEGRQVVPYDADSTPATIRHVSDSEKLLHLKKRICDDLKMVWQLPKSDRKKAIKRLYLNYHPDKADPSEREVYDEAFKFLLRQIDRLENGLGLEDPEAQENSPDPQQSSWRDFYYYWANTAHKTSRSRASWRGSGGGGGGGSSGGGGGGGGFFFNGFQPKPDEVEAKRWMSQAEADYCALCVLREELDNREQLACNVCFMAHQVVEKALKAGMYKLLGLNLLYLKNHDLKCHAQAIHQECSSSARYMCVETFCLPSIAASMEPHYINSRYPNQHTRPNAPVHVYDTGEAEEAARGAESVLNTIHCLI